MLGDLDFKVRRIVTGHNERGEAIFSRDDVITSVPIEHPLAAGDKRLAGKIMWVTDTLPADNSPDTEAAQADLERPDPESPRGQRTLFRITDLPAGSSSAFHRTETVDYGILLQGECDLVLDNGEARSLVAGDVVIQRGTIHGWINRSDKPCRWAWILVDAAPVVIGDKLLGDEWQPALPFDYAPAAA